MSLVCLGYDVDFELESGRTVHAPDDAALLYDKTGQDWPATSVLVMRFTRSGVKASRKERFAREWFGGGYDLREGRVNLPPRDGAWKSLGHVTRIYYTRGSGDDRKAKHEGAYEHSFEDRGLFDVFTFRRPKLPELLRYGSALRLEIGRDYVVTAGGFS
jgi:hypothetical protein